VSLALKRGLITLVAVLMAEAVWILAVPPFRGSDEIDHAYRAAGVASGQWHLSEGAQHGRGLLVWVPSDLVAGAKRQCTSLKYVGHDNCHAVEVSGDRSRVATAAGRYDPFFYFVVGTVAKPFHRAAADYAMRVATSVLSSLLLALGVGILTFAGVGRWVNLGVLAALTPEVLFSGAIVAPNGVEMGIAFVLWAALLAAVRRDNEPLLQRRLLQVATAAAVPLAFVRLLGPLWVVLIVGSIIATVGVRRAWAIACRHRGTVMSAVLAVFLGVCWWAAWQAIASQATGAQPDKDAERWLLAFNLPVFLMQMVGAFPYRDVPAPLGIYPLEFFVILLILGAAWRKASDPRARRAVLWIGATSLVVPVMLSLVFMPSAGAIWQGRYEIPFVIGVLPLCGLLLDEAGFAPVEGRRLAALSGVFMAISQVVCVYHVEQIELQRPASLGDLAWWHPPGFLLGVLMLVACGVASFLLRDHTRVRVDEPELSLTT
jgi:hypothetical protein